MKKTILLSSIFAVGAAFASATVDSTKIGVMGIDMPTGSGLIAVPFLGYDTENIVVADMVNTAQLAPGSKLYVPNTDGAYDVWTLNSSRAWVKTGTVVIGATVSTGAGVEANEITTARGGSFWLDPAEGSESTCYLLGKPGEGGSSQVDGGKWNLIGNTSDQPFSADSIANGDDFDQIVVILDNGALRYYTYKKSKGWRYQKSGGAWSVSTEESLTIAGGQGFWYKPKTDKTINWVSVAAQ